MHEIQQQKEWLWREAHQCRQGIEGKPDIRNVRKSQR